MKLKKAFEIYNEDDMALTQTLHNIILHQRVLDCLHKDTAIHYLTGHAGGGEYLSSNHHIDALLKPLEETYRYIQLVKI